MSVVIHLHKKTFCNIYQHFISKIMSITRNIYIIFSNKILICDIYYSIYVYFMAVTPTLVKNTIKRRFTLNSIITNQKTSYYNPGSLHSLLSFQKNLADLLSSHKAYSKDIVIVCIGSDRATGDSLGPIVGDRLSKLNNNYTVYGTLEHPVHAKNLHTTIEQINKNHLHPFIIAIDASLGTSRHVGYVSLINGSLKPGIGVNKELPLIGDVSITGIVGISGMINQMIIQTTRLNLVMNLADFISRGLYLAGRSVT